MLDELLEELRLDCKLCKFDRGYKCGVDFGIIVGFNDEVVCIKAYDRDGLYDGVKIFSKPDLETVLFNGNELNSITKFIQTRGPCLAPVELDISGFDAFIDSAREKYGHVRLNNDSDNICYVGRVVEHDDEWLRVLTYGNAARRDKYTLVIAKWKIDSIAVDDILSRNLLSIHAGKIRA